MSIAAPASSETARIALPIRVFLINSCRQIIQTIDKAIVMIVTAFVWILPMLIGLALMIAGNGLEAEENRIINRFSKNRLTAMAVIRTDSDGEPRSGL